MLSCLLQSVRTQETVPLLKAAKRVVLLTGTPALSRPKELFSQLTALAPSAKLKMKDFGERYCQCDRYRPYGGQYDGKHSTCCYHSNTCTHVHLHWKNLHLVWLMRCSTTTVLVRSRCWHSQWHLAQHSGQTPQCITGIVACSALLTLSCYLRLSMSAQTCNEPNMCTQLVLSGMTAGASNLAELNRVLNSTVMVRRLKSEVLDQLPPKRRQHVSHLGSALCPRPCLLLQNY